MRVTDSPHRRGGDTYVSGLPSFAISTATVAPSRVPQRMSIYWLS